MRRAASPPAWIKYRSAFNSTLMPAAWHCMVGLSDAAWIDFVGGRSLGGEGGAVAKDGADFRGRRVATLNGSQSYRAVGISQVFASGSRPHIVGVYRDTSAAYGGAATYFDSGVSAVSDDTLLRISVTAITATNGGVVSGPAVADTLAHRMESKADATASTLVIDSTTYTGTAGAIGHNVTAVGIGSIASSLGQRSISNHAAWFCFSQALSVGQLALLRQFIQQDFAL